MKHNWKTAMLICAIVLILIGAVGRFNGVIDSDTFWYILIVANLCNLLSIIC